MDDEFRMCAKIGIDTFLWNCMIELNNLNIQKQLTFALVKTEQVKHPHFMSFHDPLLYSTWETPGGMNAYSNVCVYSLAILILFGRSKLNFKYSLNDMVRIWIEYTHTNTTSTHFVTQLRQQQSLYLTISLTIVQSYCPSFQTACSTRHVEWFFPFFFSRNVTICKKGALGAIVLPQIESVGKERW